MTYRVVRLTEIDTDRNPQGEPQIFLDPQVLVNDEGISVLGVHHVPEYYVLEIWTNVAAECAFDFASGRYDYSLSTNYPGELER